MKYKCLILDHDDTIVNSTATIHYPAFQEYMKECSRTIPDYYIEELTKDALIEYFFDTHAEEIKQAALDLIKKDGPNYF